MTRRKKISQPQYGEPTAMVSVRIPDTLHSEIKVLARRDRISKSRKIVQMLNDAVGSTAAEQPVEPAESSVFE